MKIFLMARWLVVSCAAVASALSFDRDQATQNGRGFLAGALQPEVVAQNLARVEDEWQTLASLSADCSAGSRAFKVCQNSRNAFGKSCSRLVDAVVKGSSGDQHKAMEYMTEVCGEPSIKGWRQKRCVELKNAIDDAMKFNAFANLVHLDSAHVCSTFWSSILTAEQHRVADERKAQKEMLRKANENAKILATKRREEAAHRSALEAKRKAAIAQRDEAERLAKAQKEAAERAAAKKAAATALAIEAAEKMKKAALEAAKAEEEHRQRQLEHERAQEVLHNITNARASQELPTASQMAKPPSVKANSNSSDGSAPTNKSSALLAPNSSRHARTEIFNATNSSRTPQQRVGVN